jgi:probable non-F420 flavinoid oxidoreductase
MAGADAARAGFHCSHEQHAPSRLLELARRAEQAGFRAAMCSDHFHPWTTGQGQSGFTWSWLGAAMQATSLTFGTVCAPGQRYHPAVVAQAAATLGQMYGERFWLAVGSGEALNEAITGEPWPSKPVRRERLAESVSVMRALWAGETVTHEGRVRVYEARLYSRPATPPLVFGAALTAETARELASWADGLITVAGPRETMQEIVDAWRDGGGAGKPMYLQVALAYGRTDEESRCAAVREWPQCALSSQQLADLARPHDFDVAVTDVDADVVLARVRASSDIRRQIAWLQEDLAMGFARVYLHNVVRDDMERFIDACGEYVLAAVG